MLSGLGAFWRGFDLLEIAVTRSGLITMSMRELDRLKVIEAVVEQRLMPWRAAERLGVSRRQIERLVGRYRDAAPDRPPAARHSCA